MSRTDAAFSLNGETPKRSRMRQPLPFGVEIVKEEESQEEDLADVCAADVKETKHDWLWPDALEWGTVAMFQGAKSAGKSTWLRAIAAHVTGGPALPGCRKPKKPLGNVLWFAGEENKDNRVVPGLRAAGADLKRCFVDHALHEDPRQRLQLPTDADRLRRRILYRQARLIILDPVFSFLDGMANIEGPTQPARDFMRVVSKIAADTHSLFILARNLKKDSTQGAINAGRGSGELGNQARSVLHAQHLPGCRESMALAIAACNNGRPKPSILYHLEEKDGYPVIAIDGESGVSADDLVAGDDGDTERFLLDQAKELIRQLVGKEKIDSSLIKKKAEAQMIGVRTLQAAAKQLKVRHSRVGSRENTICYWMAPKGGFKA